MSVCISIKPNDTVFFRGARTFSAGENSIAESSLPSPLTLYGIVGNYYLESNKHTLADLKNEAVAKLGRYSDDLTGTKLRLRGPFLAYGDQPYFPAPASIREHRRKLYRMTPSTSEKESSDLLKLGRAHVSLRAPQEIPPDAKPLVEYLSTEGLRSFLAGGEIQHDCLRPEEGDAGFVAHESRTGHQMNSASRTVEEGMLYTSRHIRFRDRVRTGGGLSEASLCVDIEGLRPSDFSEKAFCIGGERRVARFEVLGDCFSRLRFIEEVLDGIQRTRRFFVYLATPAVFNGGWQPKKWPRAFGGAGFVGASVNKPGYISGWQMCGRGMHGQPRPLQMAAPAGSVYFFAADDWKPKQFTDLYKAYNFKRTVSKGYRDAGFGIALVGVWENSDREAI